MQVLSSLEEDGRIGLTMCNFVCCNNDSKALLQVELPQEKVNSSSTSRASYAHGQLSAIQVLEKIQYSFNRLHIYGFVPKYFLFSASVLDYLVFAQFTQQVLQNIIAFSSV